MNSILDNSNALPNGNGIAETEIVYNPDQLAIPTEYVDVQSIAPVNVATKPVDPWAPIEKLRLQNSDGYESNSYNVRVKVDEGNFFEAGVVSDSYLLIGNQQIHEVCAEIRTESGMEWEPVKCFFNGKQFRNVYRTESVKTETVVGDVINLMMTELNSYDQTQRCGFRVDFMVKVCMNGMISPQYGWNSLFQHRQQNVDWSNEIRRGAVALSGNVAHRKLETFAKACNRLQSPLDIDKLGAIRTDAISKLPTQRFGATLDRYFDEEGYTMWDLMQAGTYTLWHKDKMTNADFNNNGQFVDGLLDYASKLALTQ